MSEHDPAVTMRPPPPPSEASGPPLFDEIPEGDRSALPFPAFQRSCDIMRDTTKWVVSFVPGAALVVTLAGVVPDVAELDPDDRTAPIVWLVLGACAVAVALIFAVRVLAAAPPGWIWIYTTYGAETATGSRPGRRSFSRELDGSGVLHLYGYLSGREFFTVVSERRMCHVKHALGAGGTILDFAYLRSLRGRFVAFSVVGTLTAVVAVGCVAAAQAEVADRTRAAEQRAALAPAPIDAPLAATLMPTDAGLARLQAAGCSAPDPGEGVAVWVMAGTLEAARLLMADVDCPRVELPSWDAVRDGVIVPEG